MTSVRNEVQCGSCRTSSTTGALELTEASRTGHLVSLSEQEFVSRDTADSKCEQCLPLAEKNSLCTEAEAGTSNLSCCRVGISQRRLGRVLRCVQTTSRPRCQQWHSNLFPSPSGRIMLRSKFARPACSPIHAALGSATVSLPLAADPKAEPFTGKPTS